MKKKDTVINSDPVEEFSACVNSLYVDHNLWLQRWLGNEVGCAQSAADITQDTFVRVLQNKQDIHKLRTPRAWLRTVAKRILIDRRRRQQIESLYLARLAAHHFEENYEFSPEEFNIAIETLHVIARALEQCSPTMRKAFMLRFFENWTHRAIADHLQVSTKSVQKYLAKALVLCQTD